MEPISICIGIGSFFAGYVVSRYMQYSAYEDDIIVTKTVSLPKNLICDINTFNKNSLNNTIVNNRKLNNVVDELHTILQERRIMMY